MTDQLLNLSVVFLLGLAGGALIRGHIEYKPVPEPVVCVFMDQAGAWLAECGRPLVVIDAVSGSGD